MRISSLGAAMPGSAALLDDHDLIPGVDDLLQTLDRPVAERVGPSGEPLVGLINNPMQRSYEHDPPKRGRVNQTKSGWANSALAIWQQFC